MDTEAITGNVVGNKIFMICQYTSIVHPGDLTIELKQTIVI